MSIVIGNSCVIKKGVTSPHYQNYCHFMRFCGNLMFCTTQLYELRWLAFEIKVSIGKYSIYNNSEILHAKLASAVFFGSA